MADNVQNVEKDPDDWETGGEPATGAQYSYYSTLAQNAGETVKDQSQFNKAQMSKEIDRLKNASQRSAGA